ncbi:MAG: hypothetical protein CXT73_00250 [Methanobacteriota archaeon]|jgi:hypothetical protein|nr:MAG: hypothetical protein CXT73_00250 [Euryarchaeota archaeon]
MGDLIIKPTTGSGNKLIIQTEDGTPIVTTSDSGAALSAAVSGGGSTSASDLISGTLPDGRFPATLPAVNGSALTNLPAGGTTPNYTNDGWKYITSNAKDYSANGPSQFNWAQVADYDMQLHKGSNVSESGGYYTLATAGVYACTVMVLDNGYQYATHVWLFHNDVSAGTYIAHEPLIASSTGGVTGNYAAQGSFTWYVDIEANDILHIRCSGYMNGNWCGPGSPSNCFHGCRIG